jgi:hypothetical protein
VLTLSAIAGLLTLDLGFRPGKASGHDQVLRWLNAHEGTTAEQGQDAKDIANNRLGMEAAQRLQQAAQLTPAELVREAKRALSEGKLNLVQPREKP